MRKLVWLVAIAAALWSGYWVVGAQGIERGLGHWLEERRGEGWQAEAVSVETSGYPLSFETRLEGIALVDPESGLGWEAPDFRFEAQSHAPTRVAATWPGRQRLITPFEQIDIEAGDMRAALGLVPGPALVLDTSDVVLAEVSLTSSAGWTASLASGSLSTRRAEEDPLAHELRFAAENVRPA